MELTETRPAVSRSQRSVPVALYVIALLLLGARVLHVATHKEPPRRESVPVEVDSLVNWVPLHEAQALSLRSGKPILYDFTAEWCQPCHVLDAMVFQDEQFASEINELFVPVRAVDRQQEEGRNSPAVQELQDRYGIQAFPTVVFAGATGERSRMEGFEGPEEFRRVMDLAR